MSLFSDIDWVILLLAAGLLMLGGHGMEMFRTLGRLYAKFLRLRQEFMFEIQSQMLGTPPTSAGNTPLPVLQGPAAAPKAAPVARPEAAPTPASAPAPAPGVAASAAPAGPLPTREVQKGPSFPSPDPGMYR